MHLAKKDWSVFPTVHMCGDSFPSKKEVKRANEGVKRVLGDMNQDKAFSIQFFPDCGAPSVLEDVMVSNTTCTSTSCSHFFHMNFVCPHQAGHFPRPRRMLYGQSVSLSVNNNEIPFKQSQRLFCRYFQRLLFPGIHFTHTQTNALFSPIIVLKHSLYTQRG